MENLVESACYKSTLHNVDVCRVSELFLSFISVVTALQQRGKDGLL